MDQLETTTDSTDNERWLQQAKPPGFFADLWDFVRTSRKWWILPPLLLLLLLGLILVLTQTVAAPFIYTLF
jgi:hypothetical protein